MKTLFPLLLTITLTIPPVHARTHYAGEWDKADPATRSWFGPQVWILVPPEVVVYNAGNPVGEAIVWYATQSDGTVFIRCFVPGGGV